MGNLRSKGIIRDQTLSAWCVGRNSNWRLEARYESKPQVSARVPLLLDLQSRADCLGADQEMRIASLHIKNGMLVVKTDTSVASFPMLIPGYSKVEAENIPGYSCLKG